VKAEDCLQDLIIDGRIVLKWIVNQLYFKREPN